MMFITILKHLKPTDALPRIAAHAVRRIGEVSALLRSTCQITEFIRRLSPGRLEQSLSLG